MPTRAYNACTAGRFVVSVDRQGHPHNVEALITRIGFWGFLLVIMAKYTSKPYSNS